MAKRKKARPTKPASKSTPRASKIDQILELMTSQGLTMTNAALTVGVSSSTAWDWLQDPAVKQRYEMAREIAAHRLVDQAEEALDPPNDGALLSAPQVSLRIARAKQKLWRAGRLSPEYADKQVITHEGSKEKPVEHNVVMSPSEAYQRMLSGK